MIVKLEGSGVGGERKEGTEFGMLRRFGQSHPSGIKVIHTPFVRFFFRFFHYVLFLFVISDTSVSSFVLSSLATPLLLCTPLKLLLKFLAFVNHATILRLMTHDFGLFPVICTPLVLQGDGVRVLRIVSS